MNSPSLRFHTFKHLIAAFLHWAGSFASRMLFMTCIINWTSYLQPNEAIIFLSQYCWKFHLFWKLLYDHNTITQWYNIQLISTLCVMVDCHHLKYTGSTSCSWSLGQILAYAHVQGAYANEIHPRGGIQGRDQACFHGVLILSPRSSKNIFHLCF